MTCLRLASVALCVGLAAAANAAPSAPARVLPAAASGPNGALLVVTLCAEGSPGLCDVERVPLYDAPILCLPPPQLAQFVRPGWRITRWRCERGE